MMHRKKFLGIVLATTLGVTFFSGCGDQKTTTNATGGSSEKKTIKMITSPDYPPYDYYDTSSGNREIIGFDVDIAKRIAEQLGYQLEVTETDFNGIIPALQSKRADFAMAGMSPTPERKENVDFSEIYYQAQNTILTKKGSNLKDQNALAGKKVGVQLGTIQEKAAKKISEDVSGVTIVPLNRVGEIIQEIKSNRIAAAIVEAPVAKGFAAQDTTLEYTPIPVQVGSGSAIAFPKGSPLATEFDGVLKKMKESGEIEQLVQKWFSQAPQPEEAKK